MARRLPDQPFDRDRLRSVLQAIMVARSARVLVVEDDDAIRAILRDMLEREGCMVDVAENGLVALERVAKPNRTSSARSPDAENGRL